MKFHYICTECGHKFAITPDLMLCPECAKMQESDKPIRGILIIETEGELPADWDIFDLLPVEREYFPDIPVGNTPLWAPRRLREELGYPNLYLKDDTREPTFSFKDRASFLVAAFAVKSGIRNVVVASTGNAASSMAGIGAAAGLDVRVFVPEKAPKAKLAQCLQYGAEVVRVEGDYNRAFELSLEYTTKHGGFNRNTAYNPLTIEGKKTAALEIFKQLGKAPDYVLVPTGDGVILAGIYRGFLDLKKNGVIENIPKIVAVQSTGSPNLCRAVESGVFGDYEPSETVADSISVDVPKCGYYALKLLTEYKGRCVTVTDDAILSAQKELSSTTGLFAEPAAAASFAGFLKIAADVPRDASVVLLVTGSGLKDIEAAMR